MSDHDASPKEWTHAHSLRHGPQRWLSKLQRKQIKAQQAYIAAITAKEAAAAAAAGTSSQFGSSSPSAAVAGSASSSSSSRRSIALPPIDPPSHSDVGVVALAPSPLDDLADDAVPVPASIDEGGESDEESDEETERQQPTQRSQRRVAPRLRHSLAATDVTHILPDGSFAFRDNFRRQSSAPLARSWSDADGSGSGSDGGGGGGGGAPSDLQPVCTCPACEIAAAHQLAAQSFYMQSLQHVHSSIVSPAHRPAIDRSATFSAGSPFTPHAQASAHSTVSASASARPYSTHARTQSAHVQLLSPSLHIAPSFDETAMRLRGESPAAAPGGPQADSSVSISPVVVSPADNVPPPPAQKQRQSLLSSQTGVAQPVVAAAAALADKPAAAPVAVSAPAPPSIAPPAPAPAIATGSLLPRWFLIILAILRETDGRDKLAKCVQYGSRTLAILLRQLPAAIWWIGFASKHLREGRVAPIGRAINILLCSHAPNAATAAAATAVSVAAATVAEPALQLASSSATLPASTVPGASLLVGRSHFSAALRSSYLADTSVFRARLETNPLYNGALSRIAVLSAALSSGRRVIRLLKWTYTLPTWAKTFASWKAQVRASLEKDAMAQAQDDGDHDGNDNDDDQEGTSPESRNKSDVASRDSSSPSPRGFRFSHPHPPHLWRRLPWLSSVELLDLSIAVATDMSDDLEWLSKYRLFPAAWGYRCGRIAVGLWLTTVVLDLLLTFRILRHYHYQQTQLKRQIDEAQMEFATVARQLNLRQEERQDKELRRAQRRQLQHSPLFKRTQTQAHQQQQVASDSLVLVQSGTASAASHPLAGSSVSDASWSELLSCDGSARAHSSNSGSEGSSTRSSQSQSHAEEEQQQCSDSGAGPMSTGQDERTGMAADDAQEREDAQADAAAQEQKHDGGGRVTLHADEAADCVHSDDDDDSDDDAHSSVDLLQSASVEAYRRVSELRSQSGAIRVSLFLQSLNFAKFAFDLGCAAPMAWNVAKDHDSMIQTTGLMSGLLGVYKLFLTVKPAQ